MAFFADAVVKEVEKVAKIGYLDRAFVGRWNAQTRGEDDLRALTGFYWSAKGQSASQQGFKTRSAAVRDAYYKLVQRSSVPSLTDRRPKLRVVRKAA